MTAAAVADPRAEALEYLRLLDVKDAARVDPKALINEIRFFDPSQAEEGEDAWVEFRMFPPEGWEAPIVRLENDDLQFSKDGTLDWFWQSVVIGWLHDPTIKKYLIYKARQLGITLLACAYALWLMLFRPGSVTVAYSFTEDEAKKLAVAVWAMYGAIPDVLKNHVTVASPRRSEEPSEWIRLLHPDGRMSSFQALPATKKHGHGARVTFAIMDEVAYQDNSREIYKAINPAVNRGKAKLAMISTANGVSNLETGEGNFFHHLYANRALYGLRYLFLPWNAEPTRDAEWYAAEAMALPEVERNQQYPLNERDGFMLSGALYFDRDALEFYEHELAEVKLCGQFLLRGGLKAEFTRFRDGIIEIYERPRDGEDYAIGVDTATGKGSDYTSADVISLTSGAIVAHMHAKMESPRAAIQLHYLGKWYNRALIAVERQGGYGEALIVALRDGNKLLSPYSRLYRHTTFTKAGKPRSEDYGLPMGANRNQVLGELRSWIRQRLFPWLSAGHLDELASFVYKDTTPSPRAQDGCNDDRVMSLAIATEMFRQHGRHPDRGRRKWKKAKYQPSPTRQH
jgi:hypothetical protein